jgi:hypothetical protein
MKERSMTMAAKIARPCWTVFQVGGRALKYSRKRLVLPLPLASEVVALVPDEADMAGASVRVPVQTTNKARPICGTSLRQGTCEFWGEAREGPVSQGSACPSHCTSTLRNVRRLSDWTSFCWSMRRRTDNE